MTCPRCKSKMKDMGKSMVCPKCGLNIAKTTENGKQRTPNLTSLNDAQSSTQSLDVMVEGDIAML